MTKEAMGELILSAEHQMYATAKAILADDQDCADAIQEAIVKAFSNIETLKQDKFAKTWLIRIVINECYNIVRQKSRYTSLETEHMESLQTYEPQNYSELYSAVCALKDDLRIPVILYYMEGFRVKEIARILDITEGAVRKRLARARGKLKNSIQLEEVFL